MKFTQTWQARLLDSNLNEKSDFFPAEVPGNVQYDYAQYAGWEDFQYGCNVKQYEALEDDYWEYRCKPHFSAGPEDSVWFVAEGIDYIFDIYLDGQKLLTQEGMYTPVEIELTSLLKEDSELLVIIHPHPKSDGPVSEPRQLADQSCKPPVSYGWDWNPHLLISGMWMPAYIETRKKSFLRSCEPFYKLNLQNLTADVWFETDCSAEVTYQLFDAGDNLVYEGTSPHFIVKNVQLWWCNGQGEPYLYHWKAFSDSDKKEGFIGFRQIRLVRNPGTEEEPQTFPKGRYAAAITLELNGRRIFAKGSNWVNPEVFFGRITDERYEELVSAAKDANMNIFRIWGGAGINKPAFYEYCDRYGIMVWQEFMLACNNYRGTASYLKVLEQEASSVIRSLRRHPSLVLWCGGNELFNGWSGMDEQSHALRLLNKLCYELDFERPFLYTSPMPGMAHGGYLFREMDSGREVYQIFQEAHNTAFTEFGVPSISPASSLKKVIPQKALFPMKPTEEWLMHHGFYAWQDNCWLCLDVIQHYFGELKDLESTVSYSQWLQCEGYKAIFEEARRKWPYCSMAINWCYEEPWITAANNSLIAYPFIKKPAFFAVKESLRPLLASARIPKFSWHNGETFSAEIWYLNDSPESFEDEITAYIQIGEEKQELLTWKTGLIESRTNKIGPSVNFVLPELQGIEKFTLVLQTKNTAQASSYELHYSYKEKELPGMRMNM